MRIKHRIVLYQNDSREDAIRAFLEARGIKPESRAIHQTIVFNVFEDEPHWSELADMLSQVGRTALTEKVFAPGELVDAKWLKITSNTRSGYPQPEEGYTNITYDDTEYCCDCGHGLVQKNNFRMKAAPAWGRRNFMKMHWVEDELFVTDAVKEELLRQNLKGVSFRPVVRGRQLVTLENTHQLVVEKELAPGLVKGPEAICEEYHCTKCGYTKYTVPGRKVLQIRAEVLDESYDIVRTGERFGPGRMCARLILISARFLRVLQAKGWDKDVYLEPLQII